MKINPLDAHDRLTHLKKQDFDLGACCQDLINQRPFGAHSFYIFCHPRTCEDGFVKRLIWQPRLTRPKPQTNSMLFKANPNTDIIRIIWIIPPRELWNQYKKDNLTESDIVAESIYNFQNHREKLAEKEDDDLSDEDIDAIYKNISLATKWKKDGFVL